MIFGSDPRYALDPNDPSWMKIIERDAEQRFAGPASKRPFGSALYIWGQTAIYSIEFEGWMARNSASAALERLLRANRERNEHLPDGDLAFYVQLWPRERVPEARQELERLFEGLPLSRTLVVIGSRTVNWDRLEVWRTMAL